MRGIRKLVTLSVFICLLFAFPSIGNAGGGGSDPSKYIKGDIHSNQDVTATDYGGCKGKNFYIEGDVSAVGTVDLNDINVSGITTPHHSTIRIPDIDFEALKNIADNNETIKANFGSGEVDSPVVYVTGDLTINSGNYSSYDGKTIVATGNIYVRLHHHGEDLNANLIAKGSIDIEIKGCGCGEERAITGFIYAKGESSFRKKKCWNHSTEEGRTFTGVNIDIHGGGKVDRRIYGVIMAKNGKINVDIYGGGHGDKGIEYQPSVMTNDLLEFFRFLTYWREISS